MPEPRPLRLATAPTSVIQTLKVCNLCGFEIDAHDECSYDCDDNERSRHSRTYRIARYKITHEFLGEEYPATEALRELLGEALKDA